MAETTAPGEERKDYDKDTEAQAENVKEATPKIGILGTDPDKPLPPERPYLWSSAHADHESGDLKFSGFEPCYIACIRDAEWQIKRKIEEIDFRQGSPPGLAADMAPLLLRYCVCTRKHLLVCFANVFKLS